MVDRGWFDNMSKGLAGTTSPVAPAFIGSISGGGSDGLQLPADYTPMSHDVICSRGADSYNHGGNVAFRKIVEAHIPEYSAAPSKLQKTIIVSGIIDRVRELGGLFIRYHDDEQQWYVVSDKLAREKAGQAIRATLRKQKPSSSPYKWVAAKREALSRAISESCPRAIAASSILSCSQNSQQTRPLPTDTFEIPQIRLSTGSLEDGDDEDENCCNDLEPTELLRREVTPDLLLESEKSQFFDEDDVVVAPPTSLLRATSSTWTEALGALPGLMRADSTFGKAASMTTDFFSW